MVIKENGDLQGVNNYNPIKESNIHQKFGWPHAFIILLVITLAMFGDVLFFNDGRILSKQGLDLFSGEMFGRDFEFREIQNGNFPLWNPHVFSGVPFFDGVQSTALYPPNFLHLFLPLPQAINTGIALHVFLIGFFMYLWTAHRRLHPIACIVSSFLIMFSGTYFMHIYAGHLANLCAMTWVPLILLAVDGLLDRPSIGWCLLGIFAVTMQILASQPQYLYYTAVTLGIYCILSFIKTEHRGFFIGGLAIIFFGSLLVSTAQILSAIQSSKEGIRSLGTTFDFASMFSFPPENFLTIISPFFFGDMTLLPYWGRCYLWEMSLFIGITGFFLAIYGAAYGERNIRRFSTIMVFILLLLALGVHTPLFNLLYYYLPGFNKFRGTSKFIFQASLFFTILAGIGMDSLIRQDRVSRKFILTPLITGLIIIAIASLILVYPNLWSRLMQAIGATGESFLLPQSYLDAFFIENAGRFASSALLISGIITLILSFLIFLRNYTRKMIYFIAILAFTEVFIFAAMNRPVFDIQSVMINDFKRFYTEHPGDYRVLSQFIPNMAFSTGARDIWGYGPVVLKRYAQFMAYTQGKNPDEVTTYLHVNHYHRLFSMMRLKYVILFGQNGFLIREMKDVMPRINLIHEWHIIQDRDSIFKEMGKASFDPRKTVILEKPPYQEPVKSGDMGYCTIVDSSTDHLTIRANLPNPTILLITDAYSSGWRAQAMLGSIQKIYDILPANYCLMAIPLSEGEHIFRVEYLPIAFCIGKWISIASITVYFIFLAFYLYKRRQKRFNRG
ncbi:MAG: hypothetical protein ABFD82_16275 [Syntrophaceae bacterium]